ncbi:MAG: hypothetical protein WKF83_06150 [Nocardioidaceae bacterium]
MVASDPGEQPKNLGVTGRTIAPAVAVPLDEFGTVRRVGVRYEKAVGSRLVATDDVGGSRQRRLHQIVTAGRVTDGCESVNDPQGPVRDMVRPRR